MKCVVRYAEIPSADIINLTSPRYLPEISNQIGHKLWWSHEAEAFKDWMEAYYINNFDKRIQHYNNLEQSIIEQGFRNPIVITAGAPFYWPVWMIEPNKQCPIEHILISEYLGGSRLLIAQKHNLTIPCIINDRVSRFTDCPQLKSPSDILSHFTDPSHFTVSITDKGAVIRVNRWQHIDDDKYDIQAQVALRRSIINDIQTEMKKWMGNPARYTPPEVG